MWCGNQPFSWTRTGCHFSAMVCFASIRLWSQHQLGAKSRWQQQTKATCQRDDKVQHELSFPQARPDSPVTRYVHLTRTVMPSLARGEKRHWPVRNDHCFQRIVLDTICKGVWYDHIARPAYKHLSQTQALAAVHLCEQIIADEIDLIVLNQQSLAWRGKLKLPRT